MMGFGTIAGVVGNFTGSVIGGRGYLSRRTFSVGLISGGIMSGVLAGEYNNIGIATILGFLGGFIAGIFNVLVMPKMNKNMMADSQGLLGSIVVVSILGSICVAPAMLSQFYIRRNQIWVITKGGPEIDWRVSAYHLVYPAVTIVIAAVTGLLIGGIFKLGNQRSTDYHDTKFWANSYGLYDSPKDIEETPQSYKYNSKISTSQVQLNRPTVL